MRNDAQWFEVPFPVPVSVPSVGIAPPVTGAVNGTAGWATPVPSIPGDFPQNHSSLGQHVTLGTPAPPMAPAVQAPNRNARGFEIDETVLAAQVDAVAAKAEALVDAVSRRSTSRSGGPLSRRPSLVPPQQATAPEGSGAQGDTIVNVASSEGLVDLTERLARLETLLDEVDARGALRLAAPAQGTQPCGLPIAQGATAVAATTVAFPVARVLAPIASTPGPPLAPPRRHSPARKNSMSNGTAAPPPSVIPSTVSTPGFPSRAILPGANVASAFSAGGSSGSSLQCYAPYASPPAQFRSGTQTPLAGTPLLAPRNAEEQTVGIKQTGSFDCGAPKLAYRLPPPFQVNTARVWPPLPTAAAPPWMQPIPIVAPQPMASARSIPVLGGNWFPSPGLTRRSVSPMTPRLVRRETMEGCMGSYPYTVRS